MNVHVQCREDRAATSLLAVAQYNRRRGPSPQAPSLPGEMMSQERNIRVRIYISLCVYSIS